MPTLDSDSQISSPWRKVIVGAGKFAFASPLLITSSPSPSAGAKPKP